MTNDVTAVVTRGQSSGLNWKPLQVGHSVLEMDMYLMKVFKINPTA